MALGLGIDTGGTFTDGAIYNFATGQVVDWAKRQTTPADLIQGIGALLDGLDQNLLTQVRLVSLSTTLATNACVENRGGRAALFLMGYNEKIVAQLAEEYGLGFAGELFVVGGRHTQRGETGETPDYDVMVELARSVASRVDAIGVVEYWGVRNPEYEQKAKQLLHDATGLPVVAAHELTGEINSLKRAATTLLNARLLPLIDRLMHAVRSALLQRNVQAPLMIVRGDGSLMTDNFAAQYPVETLLSGPASSVMGALSLSGHENLVAVDIGGTTTDLAMVRSGLTQMSHSGVQVGRWRTGTRAIHIRTTALGGDSAVDINAKGDLQLGPQRAVPLCALAARFPQIKRRLAEIAQQTDYQTYARGVFYLLERKETGHMEYTDLERQILRALQSGPLCAEDLARAVQTRPYFLRTDRLESMGIVIKSMLTPTDIMTAQGIFTDFDKQAAQDGLQALANQLSLEPSALSAQIMDIVTAKLYDTIANFMLERSAGKAIDEPQTLKLGCTPRGDELDVQLRLKMPLVGIGAPTRAMLPRVAERFFTDCVLPKHHQVANAVGAITGSVLVEEKVIVKPKYDVSGVVGYTAHSSGARLESQSLEEAMDWARLQAGKIARNRALEMGADQLEIETDEGSQTGWATGSTRQAMLLESWVTARAVGRISIV